MNDTESKLLGLILSAWVRLMLDSPKPRLGESHFVWKARQAAITDAARWGVQFDPCWLGSDAAGRQARRRAMVNLVADGWVTLRKIHRRLSFARPTDLAIRAVAEALAVPGVEPPEVEQTWVLEPKLLTSEQAAARDAATAAELAASIADTDDKLDALRDELNTGSEPRA